jgi:DNA-directed RNA polymerase subunit L
MRIALTYGYSPDVEFCGYSIPHPSEAVLHLRIQTWGQSPIPNRHFTRDLTNKSQTM